MVKLRGPLLSLDASGTLADALTFSKWKGRNYVRRRVVPTNPQSGAQTGRRAMLSFLTKEWDTFSAANHDTWQSMADDLVVSPFHAYVSENMKNWHNFLPPGYVYPILRADAPGASTPPITSVWEENRIRITHALTSLNQNWGTIWFASLTSSLVPAVGNCIQLVHVTSTASVTWYWTPPERTTWYFNYHHFSLEGVLSAIGGEGSAVPP